MVRVATPITALQLTHVGAVRYFDTAGRLHRGGPDFMQSLRDAVCAPSFEAGANFGAHGVRRYVMLLDRAESPQDQ